MRLATHLYDRRHVGIVTMVEPLDAAALESFCLHARALVECLWRDRAHDSRLGKNDAVAGDWFDTGSWRYEPTLPPEVREVSRRTGFALAHISYKRINLNDVWGWDQLALRTGSRLASTPSLRTRLLSVSIRGSTTKRRGRTLSSASTWWRRSQAC